MLSIMAAAGGRGIGGQTLLEPSDSSDCSEDMPQL